MPYLAIKKFVSGLVCVCFFSFVLFLLISCLLVTATTDIFDPSFFDCSNYLTTLLPCSSFVHFCQCILHNEVLRSEDSVLHVLIRELNMEKTDCFPPSLPPLGNSTYTKKGAEEMVIKSLWFWDRRLETKESCDSHLLLVEIFKSHLHCGEIFRPLWSTNSYCSHHRWQDTPILYPK